ncbi:hypothetical protein G6011_05690 [Alternaria panax]|uniref:Uncharacterized protein n=1 Tax=Alternaria panax TaxID=48097 RepID=A0AAD4FHS9_9PLEO|nr:hypothetical protein G6011_05690 [Alternaria panax]
MSSPHASNSPARSEKSDLHIDVRDALANLPALPVEGLGEHDKVDHPSRHAPNSPARSDNSLPYTGVRDAFADLAEIPVNNSGQHNDAGHHEQADGHDSHSIVRDAFATLLPLPDNDFEYDAFSHMDFGHNDSTGNHNMAEYIPGDFEQALQLALGPTQPHKELSAPTINEFTAQPNDEPQVPGDGDSDDGEDPEHVAACILSGALSPGQQAGAISRISEHNMDRMYQDLMRSHGFRPVSFPAPTAAPVDHVVAMPSAMLAVTPSVIPAAGPTTVLSGALLDENNYAPIAWEPQPAVDPNAPPPPRPLYPAYTGRFQSGPAARAYRKRNRIAPKSHASDVERVKRHGRMYWVRRIYESMIDISNVSDSANSIHRTRFMVEQAFNPLDLEATAHHVFDEALAVHERGWVRPVIYHKKVVRGKLTDVSEKCLERRLARICLCLQQKKATVDDAVRGGVTLALLCDNPEARGFTKLSNNAGNAKRGERLRAAKEAEAEDSEEEQP